MHFKIRGPNLPIINDGTQSYRIVTDDGHDTPVAEYRFLAADLKSPKYNDYMEDQRRIARALLAMVEAAPEAAAYVVSLQRDLRAKYFPAKD